MNIEARKLLIEQYEALGWSDAAADTARNVLELWPGTKEAKALQDRYGLHSTTDSAVKVARKPLALPNIPSSGTHTALDVQQLGVEYMILQDDAKALLRELSIFSTIAPDVDCDDGLAGLNALASGRMFSAARGKYDTPEAAKSKRGGTLRSARAVAVSMKADEDHALDIAINDLEGVIERFTAKGSAADSDGDEIRETLRKRVEAIRTALPSGLCQTVSDAFMHVEHEKLQRSYRNTETMYGDPVCDIEREVFWASEDGYAWDMDELAQAISANKGAMRNPLSRENFTADDVAAIIRHPKGKRLAALEVEQMQLKQGVRQETVSRLRSMSSVMLTDMTETSQPSHEAVDDFLVYVATLPATEQQAIDRLRVPAKDSHTGQPFDDTIGDAVRDAKGNRLCFHKAGDLLRQAADFLG